MKALASATMLLALTLAAGCGDGGAPGSSGGSTAPPGKQGVKLTKIGAFSEPLYVAQPDGDTGDVFVVERGGTIRVIHDGKTVEKPFLDLSDLVTTDNSEQGLLSVAFAPDYAKSGRLYVDYTDKAGDTRVVEYRRSSSDPLSADAFSAREVLKVGQPFDNHNGGLVTFGPDGYLYIGLGDGGSEDDPDRNGQDLSTPLAKILRIDPRPSGARPYSIPADNPFAGKPGDRPETYSYGLRNPWRFSFDRKTGALTIGDVGQNEFEEVDYVPRGKGAGANFGWSAFEADKAFNDDQSAPGAIRPILVYSHSSGGCSVTGGYVVRDRKLAALYGRYVYGDFCAGELRSFVPSAGGARDDRPLHLSVPSLSSFGEGSDGRVYATSLEGAVYRLDPNSAVGGAG